MENLINEIMCYVKFNGTGISKKDLETYDYNTLMNALECEREKYEGIVTDRECYDLMFCETRDCFECDCFVNFEECGVY